MGRGSATCTAPGAVSSRTENYLAVQHKSSELSSRLKTRAADWAMQTYQAYLKIHEGTSGQQPSLYKSFRDPLYEVINEQIDGFRKQYADSSPIEAEQALVGVSKSIESAIQEKKKHILTKAGNLLNVA